jgi:signal transduction histidine kinase
MIRKLRIKMIVAMMLSLLIVLAVIIVAANLVNFNQVTRSSDQILQILADNDGQFPRNMDWRDKGAAGAESPDGSAAGQGVDGTAPGSGNGSSEDPGQNAGSADTTDGADGASPDPGSAGGPAAGKGGDFWGPDPGLDSPELPFESRYFSVLIGGDGTVQSTDVSHIAAVDEEAADEYASSIYESAVKAGETESSGYQSGFRYLLRANDDGTVRVIFLDCGQKLHSVRNTFFISTIVALTGWLAVLGILIPVSGRMTHPMAESYEKQRRFITDAGHEIKTPITIINADADVLTMDIGENEWVADIKSQAARLTSLTNDLIFLSRMDEEKPQIKLIDIPISDLVEETADGFRQMAKSGNKHFDTEIQSMLTIQGDPKSLRQLVSILLDNAVKYSPDGGNISLSLKKEGRNVCLKVSNDSSYTITEETVKNMFDRFYRADESRNSAQGGYGIGLSIARAVVAQHKGKISAASPDGSTLAITVLFPAVEEKEL